MRSRLFFPRIDMKTRLLGIVLLCAMSAIAFASPTTQPTTSALAEKPTTAPTSKAAKFPTPAELIKKMQAMEKAKASAAKVAYFDISGAITERPAGFSWMAGQEDNTTLRSLLERLQKARDDKDVRAVLITIGESSLNLAQAQEIRDALVDLRKAGKKTFVYADSYDTTSYMLASGATNVCMMPGGDIMILGVGIETMFYKGILDKAGVKADYVQIGEYKGAEEPYTRNEPSPELRGEMNRVVEALYDQIVSGISLARNLPSEKVKELIDDTLVPAKSAKDRGFVDHLVDQDGLRGLLKDELGKDINLVQDYGEPAREAIDLSNPFSFLTAMAKKPAPTNKPAIAVVYADGVIQDGDGAGSLFSAGGVGSETMRQALRKAARDENVKAIVLRIDSPGGSALASEVMWQATRRVAEKKPVIVSIGNMAASGGYYLASAGDYIFADPSAIVGSIGVVGGKFVIKDLFDKLGLSTETFQKGRNADLFSQNTPFNERQRRLITNWMRGTYDQFTERVMSTRKDKIKDIDKVARGRIFLAQQARELGMVDELGGTESAISYAAKKAKLSPGSYEIRVLPSPRTIADYFTGGASGGDASMPFTPKITISPDSILHMLPASTKALIRQQLQMVEMMQTRPGVLMTPYVVKMK
jgi:protease-4